jgi:hypothetical protein
MTNFTSIAESINLDHPLNDLSGALLTLFGLFLNFAQVGITPSEKEPVVTRSIGILTLSAGILQFVR